MKYWAYVNNEILGPYEKEKLFELPVFSASTLICPQTPVGEKTQDWKEASTYPEISALLNGGSGASAPAQAAPAPAPLPAAGISGGAPAPDSTAASHLPKAGTLQPSGKLERPAPVFNTEMPESKLKPLSLHKIEQAPPKADSTQSAPSFTSAGFDPMTLSQIGKRMDVHQGGANPPAEDISTLSQIDKRAGAQQPDPIAAQPAASAPQTTPPPLQEPAPIAGLEETRSAAATFAQSPAPANPFEDPAPAPVPAPAPAPASAPAAAAAPMDNRAFGEINAKLEALARTAVNKQDIEPLKEKLGQMGEVLSSMKNSQFQHDIMDKIQYLENSLSEIKTALAQTPAPAFSQAPAPAPAAAQFPPAGTNTLGLMSAQPVKEASDKPAEKNAKAPEAAKSEDLGSSGKASKIAGALKKAVKLLVTIVLLAAVALGGVYFLKQFGIFDATKFLPFHIPFLSSPQAEPAEPAAPQPFQQSGEAQPASQETAQNAPAQSAQPAVPVQAEQPPKKDLTDEVIYIGRTYAVKPGGSTLENMIEKDVLAKKGDFNKVTWEVTQLAGGMYSLNALVPVKGKTGQLAYSYEVDYAKKSVAARDAMSKKPLDALLKELAGVKPAAGDRTKSKKGKKGAAMPGAKHPGPAAKSVKGKTAAPAEDEYEYVYEDDTGGTEE